MEKTMYVVAFKDWRTETIFGFWKREAKILAQAIRIKEWKPYAVESIFTV